ncbi:GntR family transcriptional regulator [Evansella cellulosilytica]|uniref:Transcriptional regulator, GntR family n=1 Tax=Evansella cellulosilytica (strain ATCC 21833 / DSM 2522 / FERM P-1141 / JCM 9156 / N-4) TaxID=649639 RepID=E6TVB6_EVAC2|nr:GntR family transcriptional regulator [Evansella cellulosilytica]ADU29800.1 transcriptional regulator, GntR family [Evansella cellulosilytica DSM 2522]
MWIHLNNEDDRPLYVQIKDQIIRDIVNGAITPGEELPSIRRLAVEAKTSVITIKRAYQDLENEGYIITKRGKGSFVKKTVNNQEYERNKALFFRDTESLIQKGRRLKLSDTDMKQIIIEMLEKRGDSNGKHS